MEVCVRIFMDVFDGRGDHFHLGIFGAVVNFLLWQYLSDNKARKVHI